jgi:Arylsulfotransferase (ASST)
MIRRTQACAASVFLYAFALAVAAQSVYPTGTTIYDPGRAWNGYTVLSPLRTQAVIVIDMNGNVVKQWDGYVNSGGGPARIFPDGIVMAANGTRPPHQESLEIVQRDFEGNLIWRFDRTEQITTSDGKSIWSARQHHDWQREDFPAGYYSPEFKPSIEGSNTLILTHTNRARPNVAGAELEDDRLIEVSPKGEILWEWVASDHIDELGFSADARSAIKAAPGVNNARGSFDWLHINSATYVGPNHWFDEGDKRFVPDNVIISSREASFIAIVARDGSIVWRIGPDFSASKELRAIRQIIGQHHAHIIPKGLPGAGNLLVFDNGGASGYGFPNPNAPGGSGSFARANSRVLEINPVTLELVWSYAGPKFYSSNISGAQRLPNGNTFITEGASGRLFEVAKEGKIVWEYIYPVFGGTPPSNNVYRGYRLPYGWIPQLDKPKEQPVVPPALGDFRVPQ